MLERREAAICSLVCIWFITVLLVLDLSIPSIPYASFSGSCFAAIQWLTKLWKGSKTKKCWVLASVGFYHVK